MPDETCNTSQHADVVYPTTRQSMRLLIKELFGDDERSGLSPFSVRGGEESLFLEQDESGDEHAVAAHQEHEVKAEGSTTSALAAVQRTPPKSPSKQRGSFGKKGTARKVEPPHGKSLKCVDADEDDPLSIEGGAYGLGFLSAEEESSNDGDDSTFRFVQQGPDKPTAPDRNTNDADRVRRIRNDPIIFSQGEKLTSNPVTHRLLRPRCIQIPAGHDKNELNLAEGPTQPQSQETALKKAAVRNITLGSPASTPTRLKPKPQHPLSKPRATTTDVKRGPLNRVVTRRFSSPDKRKRKVGEHSQVDAPIHASKRNRQIGDMVANDAVSSRPSQTRQDNLYNDDESLISEQVKTQGHMFKDPYFRASTQKGLDAPLILKGTFQSSSAGHARRDSATSLSEDRQPLGQLLEAGYNALMEDEGQITDDIAAPERASAAHCGLAMLALAAGTVHEGVKDATLIYHNTQAVTLPEIHLDLRGGTDVIAPVKPRVSNSTSANTETRVHPARLLPLEATVRDCMGRVRTLSLADTSRRTVTGTLNLEIIAIRAMVHSIAEGMLREWFARDAAGREVGEIQSEDYRLKVVEDRATCIHKLEKFMLAHFEANDDDFFGPSLEGVPKTLNSLERTVARFEKVFKKLVSIAKTPSSADAAVLESEINAEKLRNEHEYISNCLSRHLEKGMAATGPGGTCRAQHDPSLQLVQDAQASTVMLSKEVMEEHIREMRDLEQLASEGTLRVNL